ncbi:MAG: AEC family transporter [Deltaproteobacteria bacterium]|nr:AEC family transporter [Deltaproteobacteria bacterium]
MLHHTGQILYNILLPLLLMVGFGTLLQRYQPLSLETLARVSMYLLVPSFLLIKIYDSDIPWREIGLIALVFLIVLGVLGSLLFASGRAVRAPNKTVAAVILGSIVFNAGNFGIPVAHLLYIEGGTLFQGQPDTEAGLHVQALVVMLSNLLVWFLGYVVLAVARGGRAREALGIFKLPIPYALVTSFVLREIRLRWFNGADFLPIVVSFPLRSLSGALVPMMLVALGAQLARGARWRRWREVVPIAFVKLLALPALIGATVYAFGLWPWPGAHLIIGAAAPTAVNTLILTIELDGDAELTGDIVFWTTIFSGVTVAGVIAVVTALGAA